MSIRRVWAGPSPSNPSPKVMIAAYPARGTRIPQALESQNPNMPPDLAPASTQNPPPDLSDSFTRKHKLAPQQRSHKTLRYGTLQAIVVLGQIRV